MSGLPGAEHALSVLIARAGTQHATWDSLDNKTMWVYGLAVAVFSILAATFTASGGDAAGIQRGAIYLALLLLGIAGYFAYREYFPEEIATFGRPDAVIETIGREDASEALCRTIARAIEANREPLERKARCLRLCTNFVIAEVATCLAAAISLI